MAWGHNAEDVKVNCTANISLPSLMATGCSNEGVNTAVLQATAHLAQHTPTQTTQLWFHTVWSNRLLPCYIVITTPKTCHQKVDVSILYLF